MDTQLVGIADLVVRWGYSRQGVHKLSKLPDFPPPFAVINQGRTKVWRLSDFETFEAQHGELYSEEAKKRKMVGFYLAAQRGGKLK